MPRERLTASEELIFKQPYDSGTVISTLAREKGVRDRSAYSHPRNTKRISINNCPIMLLPRAQVRRHFDAYSLGRMFTAVPDNGFQDLQLSTISVSDWMETPKSALKPRRRSDTDSGFSSIKRCVTFDNVSQTSESRSIDDLSNGSDDRDRFEDPEDVDSLQSGESDDRRDERLPDYLDTFADNKVTLSKKKKRSATPKRSPRHHPDDCNNCEDCRREDMRIQRYFGKMEHFLDWIISKWAKRKELQVLTKSNFIIRGLKPHFCNFVHEAYLHERDVSDRRHSGVREDEDDQELEDRHRRESFSLMRHWRRGSGMSGTEGRPGSPSSVDEGRGGDSSQEVAQLSWDKSYKSKHKSDTKDKNKSGDNKENDLKSFIQIPPHAPRKDPKPAWTDTVKKSGKSGSSGKKGGVTPVVKSSGDLEGADESKGVSRKRSCIRKKERKAGNAHRRDMNQDMEQQIEPVTTVIEEKTTPEPEKVESEAYHADVKVPDLPTPSKEEKDRAPKNERQRRHQLEVDFLKSDAHEPLTQEMRDHHLDFDFDVDIMSDDTLSKNKVRMSSWLTGRLALSQQSSRFTLPMDMKILEKMSPQEYLRTYCVISSRRHVLYQKIFSKNRERGSGMIVFKDIEKALKDVLVNTITSEEVSDMSQLLEIDDETNIDYQLFCGIAAFAERILYPKFVTSDTAELTDFQREKIECADFCALDWKFHGVNVNPPVRKMLKSLG